MIATPCTRMCGMASARASPAHHASREMQIRESVRIKKATFLGDYAIRFAFTDGQVSDIYLHPFLNAAGQNPMNIQHLDVTRFRNFNLHCNVDVYWDDREICFRFETPYAGKLPKLPNVTGRPVRLANKPSATKAWT